jgi:predicted Zn-dependent protease
MSYDGNPNINPSRIAIRFVPIVIGLISVAVMFYQGCQPGPFGRNQVVLLSPAQEAQLGAQAYQETLAKSRVVRNSPLDDRVHEIGRRLADASQSEEALQVLRLQPRRFDWEFHVVVSNQVNAFCLPGGKVVVYTGIVPVAETDAGLATVMGHEIGHALARHGAERMARSKAMEIMETSTAASLGDMDPQRRQQVIALLGAGSQYGIMLPFSRNQESEADHIGLILMAKAGYDPRLSIQFWQRMEQKLGGSHSEFASDHPSDAHRIRNLEGWLNEAMPIYEHSMQQDGNRRLPAQ